MTERLYFACDFFHLGTFTPGDAGEQDLLYVVLQPLLISADATYRGEPVSSPGLIDYLDHRGKEMIRANHLTVVGRDFTDELRKATSIRSVPVPLPPGTPVELRVSWRDSGGGVLGETHAKRTIGQDPSAFVLPGKDVWADFLIAVGSKVTVQKPDHLTDDQRRELPEWAYGLMTRLSAEKDNLTAEEKIIWNDYFQAGPVGGDKAQWLAYLQPRVTALHEAVLGSRSSPRLTPPRFVYTAEGLRRHAGDLFNTSSDTYAELICTQMLDAAKADERTAEMTLGRLFGFGERLKWPAPADADQFKHFMVLRPAGDDGWMETNSHSLCGLVTRIGPIPRDGSVHGFELETLTVGGHELLPGAEEAEFEQALHETWREVIALPANREFSATAKRSNDGIVSFFPKSATAQPFELKVDGQERSWQVPRSLLDVLEAAGRIDMPRGDWPEWKTRPLLLRRTPQRLRLTVDDLAGSADALAFKNFDLRLQTKGNLRLERLPGITGRVLYRFTIPTDGTDGDRRAFDKAFGELARPSSPAYLLLPKPDDRSTAVRIALGGRVKEAGTDGANWFAVLSDDDGLITRNLPSVSVAAKREGDPPTTEPVDQAMADIVLPSVDGGFNVMDPKLGPASGPAPVFALRRHFTQKVSWSVERIVEDISITRAASIPPSSLFSGHLPNFDKLFLGLSSGGSHVDLTGQQAVLPIAEQGQDATYRFHHQFSEPQDEDTVETERLRYRLFRDAGGDAALYGAVEHQYGLRLPVTGTAEPLRVSTDTANLARLSLSPEGKPSVPAVHFDHIKGSGLARETIEVRLNRPYVELLLADPRPVALRPFYEALIDFVRGTTQLVLERWVFDCTGEERSAVLIVEGPAEDSVPNVLDSMAFAERACCKLTAGHKTHLAELVAGDYDDFRQRLRTLFDTPTAPAWTIVSIPTDDEDWAWTAPNPDRLPLYKSSEALRLGLELARQPGMAIGQEWAKATFEPLDRSELADPFWTGVDWPKLGQAARAELEGYLSASGASPLHRAFSWVPSFDRDRPQDSAAGPRFERLFGETLGVLNLPLGAAERKQSPVQLAHVPYAFRPLAAHPRFGDSATTGNFLRFLVALLDDISEARPRPDIAPLSVDGAREARVRARKMLVMGVDGRPSVAAQLAQLLHVVHNKKAVLGDGPYDDFRKVVNQLALLEEGPEHLRPSNAMLRLLAATPSLYSTSKGIAVGLLFDLPRNLFRLELVKRIRERAVASGTGTLPAEDRDRFFFNRLLGRGQDRFLIDVLDDASYDEDYAIPDDGIIARSLEDYIESAGNTSSIPAAVLHYNPHWRYTQLGGTVHKRYLLPSRRTPTVPMIYVAPEPDLRRSRLMPDIPSSGPTDLKAQFPTKLAGVLRTEITSGDGANILVARRGRGDAALVTYASGWERIDTQASHFYFLVSADEEAEESGLRNDIFQFQLRRRPATRLDAQVSDKRGGAPSWKPTTDLEKWFAAKPGESRQSLSLKSILDEAERWLFHPEQPFPGSDERPGEPLIVVAAPVDPTAVRADATLKPDEDGQSWRLIHAGDVAGPGTILAAEIYRLEGDDVAGRLLRITVLSDLWEETAVRMRTVRNWRDANNDGQTDIDPGFGMITEWSDWAVKPPGGEAMDGEDLPGPLRSLVVRDDGTTAFARWLGSGDDQPFDFGPIVGNAVQASLLTSEGERLPLWNVAEAQAAGRAVRATFIQESVASYVFVTAGQDGGPVTTRLPRLVTTTGADDLGRLTRDVRKGAVMAAVPRLKIDWLKAGEESEPLLSVAWLLEWKL